MRRFLVLTAAMLLFACSCIGCSRRELADMISQPTSSCQTILWEGRTYVPYTAFDRAQCGEQIGIVDGDVAEKVYSWKGHPTEEWIITGLDHDGVMLMRETSVLEAPDGITSEYFWNADVEVS